MEQSSRGTWTSRLGFILAAAGSAIGLGNIWRYPYVTGQNGGAAFVLIYLGCVLFIGVSVLIAELALGRRTTLNPVGAIKSTSSSRLWPGVGYLGILTAIGILSFYLVVAGWTIGYLFKTAFHVGGTFAEFIHDPTTEIGYFTIFLFLTTFVVLGGVEKGIERWSKILMPLLFLILVGLMVFSLTLEGASKGVEFYLKPDFSKITGSTILAALGQAFFSLSLGMGTMITYGSYLSKNESIPYSATAVAISDTTIAFLAGLVIFPALFSAGMDPAAGPALVFNVLPTIFERMPGGTIVGVLFFTLLIIAALTSAISLLEVPVAFLVDQKKWTRKKAVWVITAITFVMGLPSALSQGTVDFLSNVTLPHPNPGQPPLATGFLDIMNFLFGSFSLTVGGLLICIFVGWVWGARNAVEELRIGASPSAEWYIGLWQVLIRYVSPVIILLVILNLFGVF
jgi:NSS family neurotransmitter:Na+ symporter